MKKLRILLCLAAAVIAAVGMQTSAFAAVASFPEDVSDIQPYATEERLADENQASPREAVSEPGTTLYSTANQIPDTGMENLVIPGMAALLAASTAALVLTGKSKGK